MQNQRQRASVLAQVYSPKFLARFWAKVNKNGPIQPHCPELGPCWEWMACLDTKGYGQLTIGGKFHQSAHRVSWQIHNGPIPSGMCVLHHCDCPSCLRISHLFLGTKAENIQDMFAKDRNRHATAYGERVRSAKLSWDSVSEIRSRYRAGGIFQRQLANEYGVSQILISRILRNKAWFETTPTNNPKRSYYR